MKKQYTAIIRKSMLNYVAICLELNLSATGETLAEVEINLRNAIELYLEDIDNFPDTKVNSITIDELKEFLFYTAPEGYSDQSDKYILKPLEIYEVAVYA